VRRGRKGRRKGKGEGVMEGEGKEMGKGTEEINLPHRRLKTLAALILGLIIGHTGVAL